MCCVSQSSISRLGLLSGLLALTALLIAFVSGSWVYTKEPVILPNSQISTSIVFKIGLWRVCSTLTKINSTRHVPNPSCVLVKYSNWKDVTDLGPWANLDMASAFISRMRSCTILCTTAVILLLLAVLCALVGHCYNDNKTVIGCGLFILGGLSLGTTLVIFVASLSETLLEISQYHKDPPSGPVYDYRYGWCFFTAGVAFLMTNVAALLSISGYLNRFTTLDEMVRQIVPGAERKLLEQQHLSTQYTIHKKEQPFLQYDPIPDKQEYEIESNQMLNKTPPDVCTTNKCLEYFTPNVLEPDFSPPKTLAGQTIPITIKNHSTTASVSFSNLPLKCGNLHQGFFGEDIGSSSGYCGRSKRSRCEPETTFADFGKRSNNDFNCSGSAV